MRTQMWINGQFTAGTSGRMIDVLDPATEELVERAPAGVAADVEGAVAEQGVERIALVLSHTFSVTRPPYIRQCHEPHTLYACHA